MNSNTTTGEERGTGVSSRSQPHGTSLCSSNQALGRGGGGMGQGMGEVAGVGVGRGSDSQREVVRGGVPS